jgi:hypothetical protein
MPTHKPKHDEKFLRVNHSGTTPLRGRRREMYWNHRVIRFTDETGDVFHKFAEVFYNDDGTLIGYHDPFMWSEDISGM